MSAAIPPRGWRTRSRTGAPRSRRGERLGAGLPPRRRRDPPHGRTAGGHRQGPGGRHRAAVRRPRPCRTGPRHRAGRRGPAAAGGAGHLHRRDIADHRGRQDRRRFRSCPRAALRAGPWPDRGWRRCGCRARPPTSAAAAPAAPSRASATGSGRRHRRAPSPPTRRRRSSPPISPLCCSTAPPGASPIPLRSPFSTHAAEAGRGRGAGAAGSLGGLDADGRITEEGKRLRALPLTPRLGRMVVDAAARGEGRLAADLALLVSERGLGGEDVHLGHRLDRFRSDRSRRAEDARRMAAGWLREVTAAPDIGSGPERSAPARCWPSPFPTASPGRAARTAISFSPMAVADPSTRPRRWRARPFSRWPRSAVSRRGARILSAAPISLAEIEADFADRIETREEVTFDRSAPRRSGRSAPAGSALSALASRRWPFRRRKRARGARRGHRGAGDPSSALVEAAAGAPPPRLVPAAGGRELSRPVRHGSRRERGRVAGPADPWQDGAVADRRGRAVGGARPAYPVGREAADRGGSAEPFRRAVRPAPSIDYEGEEPVLSIRVQELFGLAVHPTVARGKIPLVVELLSRPPGRCRSPATCRASGRAHGRR